MVKQFYFLLLIAFIGCGGDKKTMSPGDEIVGTWTLIFSSDSQRQFYIEEGTIFTLYLSSDGTVELTGLENEEESRTVADEAWDPLNYLAWRGSTISRNSSITHALPCSSYVNDYLATKTFGGCSDDKIRAYYELIGKYDQFISGWIDIAHIDTGNPAQATEVDSVENFTSTKREEYVLSRLIEVAEPISGIWSVVDRRLVIVVVETGNSQTYRYDYSIRGDQLDLIAVESGTVERYGRSMK